MAEQRVPGRAMSLPLKIKLLLGVLALATLLVFGVQEIQTTRSSIREEIEASNRIAAQLLARITAIYSRQGPAALAEVLRQTGRVRANEIQLYDQSGALLYEAPPSSYKAGRYAPDWYAALVTPAMKATVIRVNAGTLVVAPNPTRAVLDGWDDLVGFMVIQSGALLLAYLLLSWMLVRWLAPFEQIRRALLQIGGGRHDVRLPALPGREPGEMGMAFNRMAQAVQDDIASRQRIAQAEARLAAQREFTQALHRRIEDERRAIARELHDEMGQSLTAMRSIAAALAQDPELRSKRAGEAARLLFETAGASFDAMHRLIPRLRPIQLEETGLADALRDLVASMRQAHPGLRIVLSAELAGADAARVDGHADAATCAYRVVQEALTNVVRHAQASAAWVKLGMEEGALRLSVADNGRGAEEPLGGNGHYGVRGMRERAEALGGSLAISRAEQGGLRVTARIPLQEETV